MVLVLGALVLALLVAHGTSFPEAGHPEPAPQPAPDVGSCLVRIDAGSVEVVPCQQPHDMETTKTWGALDTVPKDVAATCREAATSYLGQVVTQTPDDVDGWLPDRPHYTGFEIGADRSGAVGGRAWEICVVAPWHSGKYTGSVRHLADLAVRPAAFGVCGTAGSTILVPCDRPHGWEQLGTATIDLAGSGGQIYVTPIVSTLDQRCRTLAAALIGVDDPTYSNQLQIIVDVKITYRVPASKSPAATTGGAGTSGAGSSTVADTALVTCEVQDPAGDLVDSLMGRGNEPLPIK
jgi:hypothetical protein